MPNDDTSQGERIAKTMSRAGVCSRRDAEKLIAEGRVTLDGDLVTTPATFVTADSTIAVDGVAIAVRPATRLWRYHKKRGLIATHRDPQGRPTIFDALPASLPRVISVGRLDIDSEGLMLLTNDGALARHLELPATGWTRRYRVRVYGKPDAEALARLAKGVTVDGVRYGPVTAAIDRAEGANAWLTVSIKEGKNREVRRLMEHVGLQANRLIRVAFGPFQLGNLAPGAVAEVPRAVMESQLGRQWIGEKPRARHRR
jgi:23S rRNA pseudouridine2605 synthase